MSKPRARVAKFLVAVFLFGSIFGPVLSNASGPKDLWVHPRGDTYDAAKHYRDDTGELYYLEENDIEDALGRIELGVVSAPWVQVEIGFDLLKKAAQTKGRLLPVLHYDSDGDRKVDRSVIGHVRSNYAVYDAEELRSLDLRSIYWQLGIRYVAGQSGDASLNRRYLASVDSDDARIAWIPGQTPDVAAGPVEGLVILKHRADRPFDLVDFIDHPERYLEDFDLLTRRDDADDWTVDDAGNRVSSHYGEEDFYLVRTTHGLDLDVVWGDEKFDTYLRDELQVVENEGECLASVNSQLRNHDGSVTQVPNRLLYCPGADAALFDAPDGYEIGLAARRGDQDVERSEISTSVADNFKLYADQVHPRRAGIRDTGTLRGNMGAGWTDAGDDLRDAGRHAFTGSYPYNIHTGQSAYRPSLITGPTLAVWSLAKLEPLDAWDNLTGGLGSGIESLADVTSAFHNGIANPMLQSTVGLASVEAANNSADAIGTVVLAAARNLPLGERSVDSVNPMAFIHHDRAYAAPYYTRTDTQLNIDRLASAIDAVSLGAVRRHNLRSSNGGGGGGGMMPGGMMPGGMMPGGMMGPGID